MPKKTGSEPPPVAKREDTVSSVFEEVAKELGVFALRYASDFVQGSLILLGILAFAWLLRMLLYLGLTEQSVSAFEKIHFAASSVVYTLLCVDFVFRLAIVIRFRVSAQWRRG